jgi:hypothetical protein
MKKLLTSIFALVLGATSYVNALSWETEPSESIRGIHLLSNYGAKYSFISEQVSPAIIRRELDKLDWKNNFYQFVIVLQPGISMEVGGSLNPQDGLSAMYRDRHKRVDAVIVSPPTSVTEMGDILVSFIDADGSWRNKYEFEFVPY